VHQLDLGRDGPPAESTDREMQMELRYDGGGLLLREWLQAYGVTPIAPESPGVSWKPICT
jgi:YD repeat-containing protein